MEFQDPFGRWSVRLIQFILFLLLVSLVGEYQAWQDLTGSGNGGRVTGSTRSE